MNLKLIKEKKKKINSGPTLTIAAFLAQAQIKITQKATTAFGKLQAKLSQTTGVVPVSSRSKSQAQKNASPAKQQLVKMVSKADSKNIDKIQAKTERLQKELSVSNSGTEISQQKSVKLKELLSRRNQLMQRLKKIDNQLYSPNMSRVTKPVHQSYQLGLFQEGNRMKNSRGVEYNQHQKNLQMLSRINNEKMRRQEKIVQQMRQKQEKEIQKLKQMEKNKSRVQLQRQSRAHKPKFNKFNDIPEIQPVSHQQAPQNNQFHTNQFEDIEPIQSRPSNKQKEEVSEQYQELFE